MQVADTLMSEFDPENPDAPKATVAIVDMDDNRWLQQRFQLTKSPTVLLFRHGWMHMYTGSLNVKKAKKTIDKVGKSTPPT